MDTQSQAQMMHNHPLNWVSHYYLLEQLVTPDQAAQTQIKLQDQPDIRYARVLSLSIYTNNDLSATQPSNYAVITPAMMAKCTLVLECNDADVLNDSDMQKTAGRFNSTQQNFKYIPFSEMHYIQDAVGTPFSRFLTWFPDTYVSWQKCYIQIASGGLGNTANIAFAIGVKYTWLTLDGKKILRT